ncbi:unnamed protein product [Meloidogyne enterolobii]|uniref:Uncharacterized protein n=1 Tax=Meloidogyne enterolobii TaxID=390850 RepID=A0ACB1AGR4_MELEN
MSLDERVFLILIANLEATTCRKAQQGAVTFLQNEETKKGIQGIKAQSSYKLCSNKNATKRCYPNDDSNISVFKIVCKTDICICGNVNNKCYFATKDTTGILDYMFYSHSK